ncbi:MAG: CpsD/CapB family tyrosine-protein kinase [Burkholderiales bacterium]
MSLIERALQKRKLSGGPPAQSVEPGQPKTSRAVVPGDREGVAVLEPMAPFEASLRADEKDPMHLAWDLRESSPLVSQLRNIRREIASLLDGRPARRRGTIILVTSAVPGEGKSFLALGLARVLAAEQDRRVALVDADLTRRRLTGIAGTGARSGLVDCLAGGIAVSDALCRTGSPALNFLPSGQWRADVPNLMCSKMMDGVMESFRQCDGRHVFVVDTAPVLAFGETAYLAEHADLVALVIRADSTPRAAAEEALHKLAAERPVAIVLNGVNGSLLDGYLGYRDHYGEYLPREAR